MEVLPKKRILIIDDQEEILEMTALILSQCADYHVICAKNGKDGISKALEHLPDLILLDSLMPDINGHEVCKIIKNNHKTKKIKIAMFTAAVSNNEKEISKKTQADDFIEKPFSPNDLIKRIGKILE